MQCKTSFRILAVATALSAGLACFCAVCHLRDWLGQLSDHSTGPSLAPDLIPEVGPKRAEDKDRALESARHCGLACGDRVWVADDHDKRIGLAGSADDTAVINGFYSGVGGRVMAQIEWQDPDNPKSFYGSAAPLDRLRKLPPHR